MRVLACAFPLLAMVPLPSQELLWEQNSQSTLYYGGIAKFFGDLDGDGCDDLLAFATIVVFPVSQHNAARILSGRDGSLLYEQSPMVTYSSLVGVGDFDLDGTPDYAYNIANVLGSTVHVRSPARNQELLQIPHAPVGWGWASVICGNLDCTGDGLPDLVVSGGNLANSVIDVYDHSGTLYYSIPARNYGFIVRDIVGVGDLDGDGADDFLAGAGEVISGVSRGVIVLMSGRTGTPLRYHWGPQPFDILGSDLRVAGDVDGDGVTDYAGGNKDGFRGLVQVWSGATGALLREWSSPTNPPVLGGAFLAGHDVDLDGRPDVVVVAGGYPNPPTGTGRLRPLSSRDGQDLVQVISTQYTSGFEDYADLGVQQGNPYPVVALMDTPSPAQWPRIRVWRNSPKGTRLVGAGCSSAGAVPTVGVRRVDPIAPAIADGSRIVLGTAPPDALAVCVVAPTSATSHGGVTIPTLLDPLGLPTCQLLVPPVLLALRVTGSVGMDRGYAAVDLARPLVESGGSEYAAQWVVLDPVSLAYATTPRCEFRVQ